MIGLVLYRIRFWPLTFNSDSLLQTLLQHHKTELIYYIIIGIELSEKTKLLM
jgi:hypothetical protein